MLKDDNIISEKDSTNEKEYTPSDELEQKLKSFQRGSEENIVDSDKKIICDLVFEKEFLKVKYGGEEWSAKETDSLASHFLTTYGDIGSTACLILGRCMRLGSPDVVYIHDDFDSIKEVADDCEVTAEWHIVEGVGKISLKRNQGTRVQIRHLEKLASAYLEGDRQ